MSVNVNADFGELGVRIESDIHFAVVLSRDALSRALFNLLKHSRPAARNTRSTASRNALSPRSSHQICKPLKAFCPRLHLLDPCRYPPFLYVFQASTANRFGHILHCRYRVVFLRLDFCSDIKPVEALHQT